MTTTPAAKRLKKTTLLAAVAAALLLASGGAWASKCGGLNEHGQTGGAYYTAEDFPYEQDVFSFCGIGVPEHCWAPTGPGTWTQICPYLNRKWLPAFERICVHGGPSMGTWAANSGRQPLSTKGEPDASDGMAECEHGDDY